MKLLFCLFCALTFFGGYSHAADSSAPDELAKGFAHPPDSAKPEIWWHWMDGSVTKEGITADLEAMQRVGIGRVVSFNIKTTPLGPVKVLSPQWHELMTHAAKEADRLGLKLSIHNCPGWSSSGGPWTKVENSMQRVTISETNVAGPAHFSGALPQPETKLDFYRDIAVLAIRTPDGEGVSMKSFSPKLTASVPKFNPAQLLDGKKETFVSFPLPEIGKPQFVQLEFARPFAARSAEISLAKNSMDVVGVVQVSDDGKTFRDLRPFAFPRPSTSGTLALSFGNEPVSARFWRFNFTVGAVKANALAVADVSLSPCLRLEDIEAKSGMNHGNLMPNPAPAPSSAPAGQTVKRDEIVNLTGQFKNGQLDWDAPAGRWTILRIGHTAIGKQNREAADGGLGLECDKLSSEALDAHWGSYVQKVLDDCGPFVGKGKGFDTLLIDSYEIGGQNWTPKFREEFQQRRGYDPLPWLVTFTGRVVDNPEISERFLVDMRRTIADLFAEKYYAHFKKLCNERGLAAAIEPYTGPFESMQAGASADIPMGEFWVGNFINSISTTKLAASLGHIYDRLIIGSESFTAAPGERHGRWLDDPYALKAVGDLVWCHGVNRFTLHRYASQPWTNRWPGMTMASWGTHFDRTVTWFEQSRAWMQYLTRSQFMLQQGKFVADAAYFYGESAPKETLENDPALPPGFDYDGISSDVLLNQAVVKDGRLVLNSGMSYRVLVLPPSDRKFTPVLLRKLRDFIAAGLTVVGEAPTHAPGLSGYPQSQAEVRSLALEIWDNCDGKHATEHAFGKGKVVCGQPMAQVLAALGAKPDFEFNSPDSSQLAFIHRRTADAEIYFVSNQRELFSAVDCTFRVSGKVPELWYPDTGRIVTAGVWRELDGRTTVPLQFDPVGSVFVVFRKPAGVGDHVVAAKFSGATQPAAVAHKLEIRRAVYEAIDGGGSADVTARVAGMVRDGALRVEASNTALDQDIARFRNKQLRVEYVLDGKPGEQTAGEEKFIEIGTASAADSPPEFELVTAANGQTKLCAATAGVAELQTATGKTVKLEVRDVPAPLAVAGAWNLSFPPNWGAPPQVSLPQLISWSEHADSGVKYFSGTATYTKEVEIPAAMLGDGRSLTLDLGAVKNIAEVFVNGKPLGILWKPPFRVDITDAARPGKNKLEIKVTNLWPNRLIGDEQLPADCEWSGGEGEALKSWPQWLLDGKPSPTGRLTFTTRHLWKKDDKLQPSGLLGPVTLRTTVKANVR